MKIVAKSLFLFVIISLSNVGEHSGGLHRPLLRLVSLSLLAMLIPLPFGTAGLKTRDIVQLHFDLDS